MWASGRREGKAVRLLCTRILVQLCYSFLKSASEGRKDGGRERAFAETEEHQIDEAQL